MSNEKLPPHDIDAEEAVIGSLLIDGTAIFKISVNLQPTDFYSERNMLAFETCQSLYQRNESINQITVAQELARGEDWKPAEGLLISVILSRYALLHWILILMLK